MSIQKVSYVKAFLINNFMPGFLVRLFAKPYVAGDSLEKSIETARQLWTEKGITSTIDMLGEEIQTKEEVEEIVQIYLDVVEAIKNEDFATISIKPTSFGIDIDKEYCIENLRRILTAASETNLGITLDMESSDYTDATLEIYHKLQPEFPNFGTVLQTMLFRTENDILELKGLDAHIRLCIGIYIEDKGIAYTKKSEMKAKLVEYTGLLLDHNHFVAVATHDEKTIYSCLDLIENHGKGPHEAEFQMLLGVPRDRIQQELINKGYTLRLYVPFATEWKYATNYLKRRLIENPRLAIYTIRNLFGRIFQPFRRKKKKK
ncbi:MAG: proline dehydrogenase family protein [Candidatus Heimdallarchaeota archaeon]|nr:MAG: proline dehydrogenase family protein [Candidatus Heimdallarchaeota archaeon]